MRVINIKNFVKEMLSGLEVRSILEIILTATGFFVMTLGIFRNDLLAFFVGGFVFVLCGYMYELKLTQARIWRAGLLGQKKVEEVLLKLDNRYILLNNLSLPFKNCDIDHLLVGPNGVFLIETKNYKGEISCTGDLWEYQKVGKMGGIYKGYITNPSRQLKRNVWELKSFLDKKSKRLFGSNEFPYWIQGMVVFTNEEAVLNTKDETVVILKVNDLYDYIKNFKKTKIPEDDIEKIASLLKEL